MQSAACIPSYFARRPPALIRRHRRLKYEGSLIPRLKIVTNIHYNQAATAFGSLFTVGATVSNVEAGMPYFSILED